MLTAGAVAPEPAAISSGDNCSPGRAPHPGPWPSVEARQPYIAPLSTDPKAALRLSVRQNVL